MNHYDALEVSQEASPEVIRAAYKSLMQRYHPDRHPGDAAIAERASRVVQAYEVLSDTERRLAYDLVLRRQTAGGSVSRGAPIRTAHEPGGKGFLRACVLIAIIIGAGWVTTMLLKKRLPPDERLAAPTAAGAGVERRSGERRAREVPVLVAQLHVSLGRGGGARLLSIPALGVRVGGKDPEAALRHLESTKVQIVERLTLHLAGARYDELIRPDGERYLAGMALLAINEAAGMAAPVFATGTESDASAHYGVVEVFFPRSFSVK
jgi:curved DNA-binding protein CbpA